MTAIDDLLLPSFLLGARGAIAAILTVLPKQTVSLWAAAQANDLDRARALHRDLLSVWRAVEGPNMPARVKYALAAQGRSGGLVRQPSAAVDGPAQERIRGALAAAGVI